MLRVIRFASLGVALLIISVAGGATVTKDAASPAPLLQGASTPPIPATARFNSAYGKLPLSFERNVGQTDQRVKFLARGPGYSLFLMPAEAVLALRRPGQQMRVSEAASGRAEKKMLAEAKAKQVVLRIRLAGANRNPQIEGIDPLPGKANYFTGNDPAKWRTNVTTYSRVRYRNIYRGVDLIYYGSNQRQLEYDFVVAPGANPSAITLSFEGADGLKLNERGDLTISTAGGEVIERAPIVYQEVDGRRRALSGRYVRRAARRVGFEVADYDPRIPLIVDPVLVYSTYLGGSGNDQSYAIAADSSGNAYVAGATNSANFPTTAGAFDTSYPGGDDAFVTKLNASGTALIYSTYLGGINGSNQGGYGIAVDSLGNAYVTGITTESDFPTTPGAFQTTYGGGSVSGFVTKLSPNGAGLVYSTYLGGSGSDEGAGIAIDSSGNTYVTGVTTSSNFPTTPGAFQTTLAGSTNAFITKLNATGTALIYSTYLGGSNSVTNQGIGIAVDSSGNAYVEGDTQSTDFPTTAGAFQTTYGGGRVDVFVTKLNATGTALAYSTYLGGNAEDGAGGIAVDSSGNAYVTGASHGGNFPTTAGAFDTTYTGSDYTTFVTKLNSTGTALVYSTYLGGEKDSGADIAVDSSSNAYVAGPAYSSDFPTTPGAFQTTYGGGAADAFVTKLNATATALIYSTYLGGSAQEGGSSIALDSSGNAYVTGLTQSSDFPTTSGAFQTTYGGGPYDAFVAKFSFCSQPETKDDCKDGGWQSFCNPSFKNQGQCVSWVNHNT